MQSNNSIVASISYIVVAAITAGAVIFLGLNHFQLEHKRLLNQAVDTCLQAATVETFHKSDERDAKTLEPIKSVYASCLQDKGFSLSE